MLEFDSISVSSYEAAGLAPQLTAKSADGWQVVSIVAAGSNVTAYLSRAASGAESHEPDATEVAVESFGGEETGPIGTAVVAEDAPVPSYGAVEVPAIDKPVVDTPALPDTSSLDNDFAALASQIEPEQPAAAAGGWAASVEQQVEQQAAQPAAQVNEPVAAATQAVQETAAAAAAAPAGWYADPSSRFELRYWDGGQWTEHVSRAGQQYTDPPVA